jgi:2-keto-4-pentenoate hydratase/2-oxohepta-3-ene-1,7-dioic acid hydratase in catechol pathway
LTDVASLRLVTYADPSGVPPRAGVVRDGAVHDLQHVLGGAAPSTMLEALESWDEVRTGLEAAAFDGSPIGELGGVQLFAPILYPRALFCAGANYTDHVAEMARVLGLPDDAPRKDGDKPWHFIATPTHSIVGPDAAVAIPGYSVKLDWEAEIGVVIGRTARNVPADRAMSYVAGLTIVNDLSARDHVARPEVPVASPFHWDWMSQKCFEGAKPMGPWIVPLEAVGDVADLSIQLWVNGELMQHSNSRNLIFSMAEQIAHLSTRVTLLPGDVIATGTPAGVGMAQGRFLQPGDEVRIEVGRVGILRTRIVSPN